VKLSTHQSQERRLLQIAVTLGALVPVSAGLAGAIWGPDFVGLMGSVDADSHFRYLSGLLLAIGLGYWSTVRGIEAKTARFRMLTLIVVIGGLARLGAVWAAGVPAGAMRGALVMELAVTPLLYAWQVRVARLSRRAEP
jgi:hypothetical protein